MYNYNREVFNIMENQMESMLPEMLRIESLCNKLVCELHPLSMNNSEFSYVIESLEKNMEIMEDYKQIQVKSEEIKNILSQLYDFKMKISEKLLKKDKKKIGLERRRC